jgi:hypothetical protein
VSRSYDIINVDRSTLGRVAGVIAEHHGDKGFAGSVKVHLTGSGGQSFGCFCIQVRATPPTPPLHGCARRGTRSGPSGP